MNLYELLIIDDTETDIKDAVEWYRGVGTGLDDEFIRAVDASLHAICRNPSLYPEVYKNVRRGLLRKFPYGIYYFVFEETVVVLACFHSRRNPQDWQDRV